jgi:asparagine synthase (glutamine-hydrolysing)
MCGIAGVLFADPSRPVDPAVLKAMADAVAHRGPDGEGFYQEPGVGLAHRRLSIIDLEGGKQPLGNEDGSVQVVFNGEIYNFKELRAGLEAKGHHFRTSSDTEVLVHLYEEEGDRLVQRLRGMFAFALWDQRSRKLLLARDRLGIKPLYIYRDDEKLLFGSEMRAILAWPGLPHQVDPEALENYLAFGMTLGARSIFRGVEKLPPAHVLTVEAGRLHRPSQRYWQLRLEPDYGPTADEWQEAIRAKVDEAVRLHLVADVPVGAFLSGGLDSAVVATSAARSISGVLQTFTIGFKEEAFNELEAARETAGLVGSRHHEEMVLPDAVALLDEVTSCYGEPFADPSAVPTFLLARLASRSVKVALSGDGGDEAFGGYTRYVHDLAEAAVRRCLPAWLRRGVLGPLAKVWPKADWLPRRLRAKTLLTNLSLDPGLAYANTVALCRPPLRRRLLNPDLAAGLNGQQSEKAIAEAYAAAPVGDELSGMLAVDTAVMLPDDFLVKVDRASMAHGLEVRPPLLDHELFELAARIPSNMKIRGGETKWIFKQAYAGRLPGPTSRPKQGFDMPIDAWLAKPLRDTFASAVLSPRARVAELVNQAAARDLFHSHCSGAGRHGAALWSLLVLARWAERYLPSC